MELKVDHPVVLLMGKTGAGKSTLGNLLTGAPHNNGPFPASKRMDSLTKVCKAATMLIDGVPYNIVDTPGIKDTQEGTGPILDKIAKTINKCAHGVKAILIVFELTKFNDEEKNTLNEIRTFLGRDATNNIITVISKADEDQTKDRQVMEHDWNQSFHSFIQGVGNRWGISPNHHHFSPDDQTHKIRLREIKDLIKSIQGVYTTEQLEKNLQERAEAKRQKEEDERRARLAYEEKLKDDARREAEEDHQRQIDQLRQESERQHGVLLDSMEQARRAQERRENNLRREIESLHQREIESLHQREIESLHQERERQERERQATETISIRLELRYVPYMYLGISTVPTIYVNIHKNEKVKALEKYILNYYDNKLDESSLSYTFTFYKGMFFQAPGLNTKMKKEIMISTYFPNNDNDCLVSVRVDVTRKELQFLSFINVK